MVVNQVDHGFQSG